MAEPKQIDFNSNAVSTETEIGISFSGSTSIWKDKECLNHGYTPRDVKILHREKEITAFTNHLADAVQNIVPGNLFLYGKSGTGKTMITRLITSVLEKSAAQKGIKVKVVYVHCGISRSNIRVLRAINDSLEMDVDQKITPTTNSFGGYFSKFCQLMQKHQGILIIILDEMDKLQDPDIMNYFARVKESGILEKNVCIIGITNDLKFEEMLDSRTMSVLGRNHIVFTPYDANQLRDILEQRAKFAFLPGVLDETVIPLCAAYAAQEHGDARKAIELLKLAGIIASEENQTKITEEHVKKANNIVDINLAAEVIRTLPTQSKLVLLSCVIDSFKEIKNYTSHTGEIYNVYKEISRLIGIEVLTQRRVTALLTELNTLSIVNINLIFKGRYGSTKEVSLTAPGQAYYDIIMEDSRIKEYSEKIKSIAKRSSTFNFPVEMSVPSIG